MVFAHYDPYVGSLSGRYCFRGIDEGQGIGANPDFLFFYEMHMSDAPFIPPNDNSSNDELRRRGTPYHDELKR